MLTVEGMAAVEKAKKERVEALARFTSKPFDPKDIEQQNKFREYIDSFECSRHQMYFFQGMSAGLKIWFAGYFLPLPEFANYFFTISLYCGVAGHILQHFSINEFHDQLNEMKVIYNWCLKGGQQEYNGVDNTAALLNSDVQRLMKILAPLCTTDFMVAWKKEESQKFYTSAVSYVSSFFTASHKVDDTLNQLYLLKNSVEKREFDVGAFKGCQEAIHYFFTSIYFKDLLMTKLKQPIEQMKSAIPSLINSIAPP